MSKYFINILRKIKKSAFLEKALFLFKKNNERKKLFLKKIKDKLSSFLRNIFNDKFPSIDRDIDVDKTTLSIFYKISEILGKIYDLYKKFQDLTKIWFYKLFDSLTDLRIFYEVIFHSRGLIFILILLLLSFIPHFLNLKTFLFTKELINTLLITYSGGATAILGIIFALYSVGFQTTTARFSSNVTDYLNREKVGRFFFRLLTLSAVFSIINLIIQEGVTEPIFIPFIISTILFIVSLIGIVIFKDDYMTKLKPKEVFQRLYNQNFEAIKYINDFDCPRIKSLRFTTLKNVKTCKIYQPICKSWSLVMSLQKQVDDRLEINESLYNDLIREGRVSDATFGIVSLGYLLAEYCSIKHFIDRKNGWWFPVYQEVVTSESAEMFPIKANYESMGIGRLSMTKRDYDWLENKILKFFNKIQSETDFKSNPLIGKALTVAYEIILAGKFVKTSRGYEKKIRGCFENQEFDLFDKSLKDFISLGEKLSGINKCEGDYLNSFGQIKTVCIDGFSFRTFPGKINDWKPDITSKIKKFLKKSKLNISCEEITSWKLPAYIHQIFFEIYCAIEVENSVEGKVITPIGWLERYITQKIEEKESETSVKYREQIVQQLITISNFPNNQSYKDYSVGIILGLFNQLISQEKWDELKSIIGKFCKELLQYFSSIDHQKFLEQEYREPIDFGVFNSIVERKKSIFVFYLKLFFMSQIHLFIDMKRNDLESMLKIARRPLMLGGIAYLISELDQDDFYVTKVTQEVEKLYPNGKISEIYRIVVDSTKNAELGTTFQITYEEANRYRHYFRKIINSISNLPRDYINSSDALFNIPSGEVVRHPSEFIRKMGEFEFYDMDECCEGYVEWLEKRDKMKDLIKVLNFKNKQNE